MEVYDKTFEEEVINSQFPVLIEFWASWCIPCKMMEYILKDLKKEFDGKVKILKLNVDRNRRTPKRYNLTGIPTLMTFIDGKIIESRVGAQSKENLIQMIKKLNK